MVIFSISSSIFTISSFIPLYDLVLTETFTAQNDTSPDLTKRRISSPECIVSRSNPSPAIDYGGAIDACLNATIFMYLATTNSE